MPSLLLVQYSTDYVSTSSGAPSQLPDVLDLLPSTSLDSSISAATAQSVTSTPTAEPEPAWRDSSTRTPGSAHLYLWS